MRSARSTLFVLSLSLAVVAPLATAACGADKTATPPVVTVPPQASGSASAGKGAASLGPLPPMAPMPPPGVAGSRSAKTKSDGALFACTGSAKAPVKDPAAEVKRVGEACAAASKMHPVGALLRGTQSDKDPSSEQHVSVSAGHCYRVYFAADEGVKDMTLLMRDAAGDLVAESPGVALPDDGAMCFSAAGDAVLMIAVGAGKGSWAAQVWSD